MLNKGGLSDKVRGGEEVKDKSEPKLIQQTQVHQVKYSKYSDQMLNNMDKKQIMPPVYIGMQKLNMIKIYHSFKTNLLNESRNVRLCRESLGLL